MRVPRMQASAGKQAFGIFLHVIGDELVHSVGEADHFRGHVVNQHGAIDAARIHVLEKRFWGAAEFGDLVEVGALGFHQRERVGFEHLDGLNVDVAVGDQKVSFEFQVSSFELM